MIICITGTPGTGKTAVARELAKLIGNAKVISINRLIKKIPYKIDKKRKTKVVDIKDLRKAVNKMVEANKVNIVEGHLSHFINSDFVIILRSNPVELRKRLKAKGWRKQKIEENVQAEILGVITAEVSGNAFEIDTSHKKPKSVARLIKKILNNPKKYMKYRPGRVDWIMDYEEMLC